MSQNNSYPSPTGLQEGGAPFYNHQNQPPGPQGDDMSLDAQLRREIHPEQDRDHNGVPRASMGSDPQQHSMLSMAYAVDGRPLQHTSGAENTPERKKAKVSRACDECRRKKVRQLPVAYSFQALCN
jgi:hypothetical protein